MWAAIFPGQGSQHVGMGKFLYENFALAKNLFEEASDVLSVDFKRLCFSGPEEELALTENTQPALLLVSTATYRVLQSVRPISFAGASGHSVGEYAALVAAGSLNFADAVSAVRSRGQAMQSAVPVGEGGMLAVLGLLKPQVEELCKWVESETGGVLEPANFNTSAQTVISGQMSAIQWLCENYRPQNSSGPAAKAKLIPLKVSAPFHCSLMEPAKTQMESVLNDTHFADAKYPVVQNVNAQPEKIAAVLRKNLLEQITAPVRWVECVETLKGLKVQRLIEFGSGQVLKGLVKKIDAELEVLSVNSLEDLKKLEGFESVAHA